MKYYISLLFVTSIVTTSCKNDTVLKNSTNSTTVVPFTEVGNQMKAQSQATIEQQALTNNKVAANPATPVAAGMNPVHGQPGHRCDIPVGAPLNTPTSGNKSQNITVPTTTVTNTPNVNSVTTTTTVEVAPTPEGMNPPHGQANHRCDITVGAPLPKE